MGEMEIRRLGLIYGEESLTTGEQTNCSSGHIYSISEVARCQFASTSVWRAPSYRCDIINNVICNINLLEHLGAPRPDFLVPRKMDYFTLHIHNKIHLFENV